MRTRAKKERKNHHEIEKMKKQTEKCMGENAKNLNFPNTENEIQRESKIGVGGGGGVIVLPI
jgi:hypothetical protein